MNAPLGLSKVDGCEVYHITTLLYEIEKEYDTTEHSARKYKNDYKKMMLKIYEKNSTII